MVAVDISPAKDNGVLKEIIKEGIGDETPAVGNTVVVHYTGTLTDGTKFDSSKDRNEPFEFVLGREYVIKAWDICVATMKKGEVAIITCAPEYAYRKAGSPPMIPPNATLTFEIEILGWKGEDLSPNKDWGIQRFLITPGKASSKPQEGGLVNVHLIGKFNDAVFEDREVQFCLGEGEDVEVIDGIEEALKSFTSGEKSKLVIKSKYAFKKAGKAEFNIPPDADVEYIVELKSFEKGVEPWLLDAPQSLEQATLLKNKGTNYCKAEKYNLAIKMFDRAKELLKYADKFEDTLKTKRDDLLLSIHLNLALCYLKTNQNIEVKDSCTEALTLNPLSEKALFRRGQAHLALSSPEVALMDFKKVLEIEPKNSAAITQIKICNNHMKQQLVKERKLYANMFDKFAQKDKQKEEEKLKQQPDVMRGVLGEWGQEERPGGRDATAFEKENPNILMLNANSTGEFQNM